MSPEHAASQPSNISFKRTATPPFNSSVRQQGHNVTRYEDLTKLAAKDSEAHFKERAACANCAHAAASHVIDYLQAPHEAVCFAALDADLHTTGETSKTPELRRAPDCTWYFGLQIRFQTKDLPHFGIVTLAIGIWPSSTGHVLEFEREFAVTPGDTDGFLSFAEHIADSIASDYSRPRRARSSRIGFVPVV